MGENNLLEEIFDIDNYYKLLLHDGISKEQKNLLRKYKKLSRDGNKVLIQYEFGKRWKTLGKGDVYPDKGVGLACFQREIRSALSAKYYWDLDIANAHPSILQNYCKENGLRCDVLDRFILQRKEILQNICDEKKQERWWAKEECIKVFNGGASLAHPILLELLPEIEKIRDFIVLNTDNIYQTAQKIKKGDDAKITTISIVLQDYTKQLLDIICNYLKNKNRRLDVKIHDGGLVRKFDGEKEFPPELIREIEANILEMKGWDISLEIKPLIHSFIFEEKNKYIDSNIIIDDAYSCKRFVKFVDIRKCGSEIIVFNPVTRRYDTDVKQQIANNKDNLVFRQLVDGKTKIFNYGGSSKNINNLLSLLPQYVESKEYPYIFEYSLCEEEHPELDEDIWFAFNKLMELSCKGDINKANYLTAYYAHIIQKPYDNPGVALCFTGVEGCGKDTQTNFILRFVVGDYNSTRYGSNFVAIFEKHDLGRMNKLIIKIEEPNKKVCYEEQDAIKAMITEETTTFNPKNVRDPVTVPNYNRHIYNTNYGCPLNITDKDRRIGLFDVSDEKVGDLEFWNFIYKTLYNSYAGKVIGNFLESIDISEFNPRELFESEYKEAIQENNISTIKLFVKAEHPAWDDWMTSSDLLIIYQNWCKEQGFSKNCSDNSRSLGKQLTDLLRDNLVKRKMKDNVSRYLQISKMG